MDYNTTRMETCVVCGKRFMDDCGDPFCSSSCERAYEAEQGTCEGCGEIVGEENLDSDGYCEECQDEE